MVAKVCRYTRHMSGIIRVRAFQNRIPNSKPPLPKAPPGSFRNIFFQSRSAHLFSSKLSLRTPNSSLPTLFALALALTELGTFFSSAVSQFGARTICPRESKLELRPYPSRSEMLLWTEKPMSQVHQCNRKYLAN